MTSTPVQVLHGLYLGLLAGVVPALVAFALGFLFRYVIGVSIPAFGVVVLGVALAGVNGGLLAFADPTITQAANSVTLVVALLVVLMLTLYTHAVGDRLGADLPRRITLRGLRDRTLNADVVDFVGGRREATVRVVGAVRDVEGYPPVPEQLRAELRAVEWQFPADLRLSELETRVADRLRSEFDLQEVTVTLDERGRATVAAAPATPAPTTTGGEGRVTVAVSRGDADRVLASDGAPVVVASRGTRREYELLGVLRRAGQRVQRLTVGEGSALAAGTTPAAVRDDHGVAVLAVRGGDGWRVAPAADSALAAGDEVFVAGSRSALARFAEVAA